MEEQPSKEVLRAIAIIAQAVAFSPGLSQEIREAISDHMIGVGDAIEAFDVSTYFAPHGHR